MLNIEIIVRIKLIAADLVAHFEKLARERGADAVFPF